ncbi:hypothetical protein KY326_03070, partial [Candidatus Woesearchaeota archaeon]|nr:hypothetical protein [Candidatus Woesearchaeota archaeon]
AMVALQEAYKYLVLHKNAQEIIEEAVGEEIELPQESYFEEEFSQELEEDNEFEDEDNSEEE